MTGDGGAADGLSQGERRDSNYKRQEGSCWLARKNLSKQSREARASPASREGSVTGDEDFCPQAASARPEPTHLSKGARTLPPLRSVPATPSSPR